MRRTISIAAASIAIALGLLVLAGCFYIPSKKLVSGTDATQLVGVANSDRQFKVGTATRDQIRQALGLHYWPSMDHTTFYSWSVQDGFWVYPLCFISEPQSSARVMRFTFNDAGVLQSFEPVSIVEMRRYLYSYRQRIRPATRNTTSRPCPTAPTSSTN